VNGHPAQAAITLRVDGQARSLTVDTRTTLPDALRERLGHTSPKKGCDHGQWVLLDGEP
jgi:xanthine dehydrogenase YagT iron-sulfur-binding subunit